MAPKYMLELKKYRLLHGELTQEELGRKMGLSRQSICEIERGRRTPTLEFAYRLSKFLGMSIEELFFTEQEKTEG